MDFDKEEIIRRYKEKLGIDISDFLGLPNQFIRVNTLKADVDKVIKVLEERGYQFEKLSYLDFGFKVLNNDKIITKEVEHAVGYIFSQDASSMLVPLALELSEKDVVLDLCAAPGAKTTEIAQLMNNNGVIVANDVRFDRIKALASNIQRMGVLNTIITLEDGRFLYKKLQNYFDKVLVDAPCSATGTFKPDALIAVNEKFIKSLQKLQKSLLRSAYFLTKKDGIIVYSTCSLEIEENEEVVKWFLENFNVEIEEIKIKGIKLIDALDNEIRKAKRVLIKGQEAFFISKFRKV
ncbi:MAG: RsmB/NOP family class I SAM-dependent RNA methyltransferase [Candidatus Aenigmatarchaeota archaeon]